MKRVALIGTHGTRKSTRVLSIAADLKKRGIEAGILPEVARTSPFPLNEGRTEEGQRWVLYMQLAREEESTLHLRDLLVCDRCILDNYAYYTTAFGRREELDNLVKGHLSRYDAIIFLPMIEGGLVDDGVRSVNTEFQKQVDEEVKKLLEEFGVEYKEWKTEEETISYIIERCGLKT